jgi:hypothetical protein
MFFSGMYAAAFFESDPRKVVEAGLASIPADSGYGKVIRDVLDWSAAESDWRKTWHKITDKWDRDDVCPDGALNDFNIDARLNGAFVALGLLYGGGDFSKTLEVSTRSGQDSDCNPSSAAGILGVMIGYTAIPDEWKSGIAAIADTKFDYTNYTFNEITKSTVARALKVVERAGGQVSSSEIVVPFQAPKAPALEQWDVDPPTASLLSYSGAWTWSGGWEERPAGMGRAKWTNAADARATLQFSGTGVVVQGQYDDAGGKADVLLDGSPAGTIDASTVFNVSDSYYWFVTGLKSGAHTVEIRMQSGNGNASGPLAIEGAIVYGK